MERVTARTSLELVARVIMLKRAGIERDASGSTPQGVLDSMANEAHEHSWIAEGVDVDPRAYFVEASKFILALECKQACLLRAARLEAAQE